MDNRITMRTEGSPFQPGEVVLVVAATDEGIHDVTEFIGRRGVVKYLEYKCGCGQTYPGDPMIGVAFPGGANEEFWHEELQCNGRSSVP